jgi:hypothetical protein
MGKDFGPNAERRRPRKSIEAVRATEVAGQDYVMERVCSLMMGAL